MWRILLHKIQNDEKSITSIDVYGGGFDIIRLTFYGRKYCSGKSRNRQRNA